MRRLSAACFALAAACTHASQRSTTPIFERAPWRIRLDVDSAPSRRVVAQPTYGSIDFATSHYDIDLYRALGRREIANKVRVSAIAPTAPDTIQRYRIILGDSTSIDDKVVLTALAITADSLVGTWNETILCCSATGRFSLWRGTVRKPR